ncbi:MAG TPA: class I SAM-dependent methyltransferase [Pyrinomonadaceae bacterium]|nr:class I SAM-dependent methyltransferase [Pyrinomonadaceae bacterium]
MSTAASPDWDALKTRLRATWIAGDFGQIAKSYATGAEEFINGLDLRTGMCVLDVACGTGNLALPAARRGAIVTGVDIAPNLIEQASENAQREGLDVQFDEGDVEKLPYADASFDAAVTMFGAMFAPRPDMTAAEMTRVVRPGGFIAMANWTPAGFIGQMFKIVAGHVQQPPGMSSAVLWGVEETVRERLRDGIVGLEVKPQMVNFKFPFAPAEVVEHFRVYYGPTNKAFNTLDETGQTALRRDLDELWEKNNLATDGTTDVEAEYLKVFAVRG